MDPDRALAELAEGQYGVAGRSQARALGLDRAAIARRCRAGRWEACTSRVLRRTGAPRSDRQQAMIAVLDAGPNAVLSHRSAASLWQLRGFTIDPPEVSLLRGRDGRETSGSILHRPRDLPTHHVTRVEGIPCTTLGRTLFDLAGAKLPPSRMERLLDDVITRAPAMLRVLHDLLAELGVRGRPGISLMRDLLDERPPGTKVPASGLEARFEQLLRSAGESGLERQVDVGGHSWVGRVDYLDPSLRLIFEIDSVTHHSSQLDRRRDAERDRLLHEVGFGDVVRIPAEAVWSRPQEVVEMVRRARHDRRRILGAA